MVDLCATPTMPCLLSSAPIVPETWVPCLHQSTFQGRLSVFPLKHDWSKSEDCNRFRYQSHKLWLFLLWYSLPTLLGLGPSWHDGSILAGRPAVFWNTSLTRSSSTDSIISPSSSSRFPLIVKTFADKFIIESDLKALLLKFMRIEFNLKRPICINAEKFQWLTCMYIIV